jgi:hypothetical protein
MPNIQQNEVISDDSDVLDPKSDLIEEFRQQIRFRQRILNRYPDDLRNTKAIELFSKLIESVPQVSDVLLLEFDQALDDMPSDDFKDAFCRSVGFKYTPSPVTAETFIRDFIQGYGDWKKQNSS